MIINVLNYENMYFRVLDSEENFKIKCEQNGISYAYICSYNKIKNIEKGDVILFPKCSKTCHIVKPMESLSKIAKIYGVSEDYIKENNKIKNVFIGQKLFI